jgi:hypothetical protein
MKRAMGGVIALALGVGLAASAQANNLNQQSATQPYMQSGSTQQMQQPQARAKRQAVRQLHQKRIAAVHKTGKTRLAAMKRHNRTQLAGLHGKTSKTRLALHRQNRQQSQELGVGSGMPNSGRTIPQAQPNSAGGTQNLNSTQPQNQ